MNRRSIVAACLLVAIVAVTAALVARPAFLFPPPSNVITVAGDVRDDLVTVVAPAIQRPAPDFAVGIPTTRTASAAGRGTTAPIASRLPTISGAVTQVYVREGDTVTGGQTLVRLDTTLLTLGVAQARTASAKQRANYRQTADALDKIDTAASKLSTARSKLVTVRGTLLSTRAKLLKGRAQLAAQIKQLEKLISQLPPMPPGPPPPGPPQPNPKVILAQLKTAFAKLNAGLKLLDTGLAKLNTGFAQLAKAKAQLATAREQIKNARALLKILADSSGLAVDLAKVKRNAATVMSPATGLVTYAVRAGGVAMVGAPLVRIRRAGPLRVDTYLTSDQLASVRVGSEAAIESDSLGGLLFHGRVTVIGSDSIFPPTSFPTQIVHMTRATRVTITLDPGEQVPVGTPVDVSIRI